MLPSILFLYSYTIPKLYVKPSFEGGEGRSPVFGRGGEQVYWIRINTPNLAGEDKPNDVRVCEGGEGGSAPSGASTKRRGNEAGVPRGGRSRGFGRNQG